VDWRVNFTEAYFGIFNVTLLLLSVATAALPEE
jgi:hypothetical protein